MCDVWLTNGCIKLKHKFERVQIFGGVLLKLQSKVLSHVPLVIGVKPYRGNYRCHKVTGATMRFHMAQDKRSIFTLQV